MSLKMIGDVEIPIIGLGTSEIYKCIVEEELEKALDAALEIGYRHIDTAAAYQNEHIIGRVLKKWFTSGKLQREDLFITTKLGVVSLHADLVESELKKSLEKLQVDYVDLYLLHFPIRMKFVSKGQPFETLPTDHLALWKKMEEQVDAGRARTIGISNFAIHQIDRIIKNCRIKPANTQVELQLYNQQKELRKYCEENNIVVVAYSSLGSPGRNEIFKSRGIELNLPNFLEDPLLTEIGKKYRKTTAQIILRYFTQIGIVVIPKSVKPERLLENFNILDFKLNPEDLKTLEALDKGEDGLMFNRESLARNIKEHPEYPFRK